MKAICRTQHDPILQMIEDGECPEGQTKSDFIRMVCNMGYGKRLWSVYNVPLTRSTGEFCWTAYQCFLTADDAREWAKENASGRWEVIVGY